MIDKFSTAVIRTSTAPYELVKSILTSENDNWIVQLLNDDFFICALNLASPDLLEELEKMNQPNVEVKNKEKLKQSLVKYVARMSTRCTPFGLFSGVGTLPIASSETDVSSPINLAKQLKHKRHFRLDTNFVVQLVAEIAKLPAVINTAKFYVNTTLYKLGDRYRLINYTVFNKARSYDLMSVETNDFLDEILAKATTGITKAKLEKWLINEGIDKDEANDYLNELIGAQLLITQLEASMIGDEIEIQLLDGLKQLEEEAAITEEKARIHQIVAYLSNVIKKLDTLADGVLVAKQYNEINQFIKEGLPLKIEGLDARFLLQCNVALSFSKNATISSVQEQLIRKAIKITNHFQKKQTDIIEGNLGEFIKSFSERYEEQFIPLTEVLDVEVGIGYGARQNMESVDTSNFLDKIPLKGRLIENEKIEWNKRVFSYWCPKFNEAIENNAFSVEITQDELNEFEEIPTDYSSTFIAKAGFYKEKKTTQDVLFFEAYAGGTASHWYGRFCNSNEELSQLTKAIIAHEQLDSEEVVVAEINHLPESRLGNVIHRKHTRQYQINYLASINKGAENEIPITDLLVGIRNGKVILMSKKLQKEVRTYHSNAFNTNMPTNLPVFQFLADLTAQYNACSGSLNFSPLHKIYKFIPRITFQNIIFQRASWSFTRADFEVLLNASKAEKLAALNAFRKKWQLPKQFVISHSDNELYIDVTSKVSRAILLNTLKKSSSIVFTEFLMAEYKSAVVDEDGNQYNNEVLFNYKMDAPAAKLLSKGGLSKNEVTQSFAPGTEWMYYKVYLGIKTGDKFLVQIEQLAETWSKNGLISQWFFIRYNDPNFHVRIRFRVTDISCLGVIMEQFNEFIQYFQQANKIGQISMETYQRELDRYGYDLMPVFESVFHRDSQMTVALLAHANDYGMNDELWLPTLYNMSTLITLFQFDSSDN